ncbi:MAG: hypothetical protein ACOC28_05105 [Alkalispirochaetaceae bacterium]
MIVELIGYFASFMVAVSLLMVSFVKLRLLNLIGSAAFVTYGVLISSIPIVAANLFIALINIYHLTRILRSDVSGFDYVPVDWRKRGQLEEFVQRYLPDIVKHYPDFSMQQLDDAFERGGVYLAVKDLRVEGFAFWLPVPRPEELSDPEMSAIFDYVHGALYPDRSVYVPVDYVTRRYRDLGLHKRLHKRLTKELAREIQFVLAISHEGHRNHDSFLNSSGHKLQKSFKRRKLYVKSLAP